MVSQQFQDIPADRWTDIKQVMHSDLGLTIDTDSGSGESHGIHFAWLYSAPTLTVSVTVPVFGWALKLAGYHCENDVMAGVAKKINGVS